MANIPIRDIPGAVVDSPDPSNLIPMDNGSIMQKTTIANAVNTTLPLASQATAEAGVNNSDRMSSLRTKQAIDAQVPSKISTAITALNLGTMSQEDASDYTPTSGLAAVALSNDYEDLSNLPTLGTAAATNASDYATAAQGALADTALQPGGVDVQDDLNTTGTPSATTALFGDGSWKTLTGGGDLLAANNLSDLVDFQTARANLGVDIHAMTAKTTPVDADEFSLADSAASFGLKKLTFANLKTYLDGLYPARPATTADNTLPRFDGTTGQIQSSAVVVDDDGNIRVGSGSASAPSLTFLTNTGTGFYLPGGGIIGGSSNGSETFRFNSGGLLVGATTASGIDTGSTANVGSWIGDGVIAAQNNSLAALRLSKVSSTGAVAEFRVSNSLVGSISVTGSATAYNTSSDYRLDWKEGAEPLAGSGAFIDGLTPYYFPKVGYAGFIAHEFQAVSPSSVTGEKDAVDDEGEPVYQAMQASSSDVMAHIIAELQSLRRRVAELEDKQ